MADGPRPLDLLELGVLARAEVQLHRLIDEAAKLGKAVGRRVRIRRSTGHLNDSGSQRSLGS